MTSSNEETWFRFHQLLAKFTTEKISPVFAQESQDQTQFKIEHEKSLQQLNNITPLETLLKVPESVRRKKFFQSLKNGDVVEGKLTEKSTKGLIIKLTKVVIGKKRLIKDLAIKGFCNVQQIKGSPKYNDDPLQYFEIGDQIRVAVIGVNTGTQTIELSLIRNKSYQYPSVELGLVMSEEESDSFGSSEESGSDSIPDYLKLLKKNKSFFDPGSVDALSGMLEINTESASFLKREQSYNFAPEEYADKLKERQSKKWSMDMVATGVKMFKEGKHGEASRCFDQALVLCPRNVEAIVARGALKANQGNIQDSINDFREALEISPTHKNGRKYLAETLTSLGKRHEKDGKWKAASQCYKEVIELDPSHDDTVRRLRQINQMMKEQTAVSERKLSSSSSSSAKKPSKDSDNDRAVDYLKRLLDKDTKGSYPKKNKKAKGTKKKKKGKHKKKRKQRRLSCNEVDTEETDSASDDDVRSTGSSDDEWVEKPVESFRGQDRRGNDLDKTKKEEEPHPYRRGLFNNEFKNKPFVSHGIPASEKTDDFQSVKPKNIIVKESHPSSSSSLSSSVLTSTSKLKHFSKEEMGLVEELLRGNRKAGKSD